MLHIDSVVQATVNGEGWEVQEFVPRPLGFSHVGKWGWHRAESFPDVYGTRIEAEAILARRLKGDIKELRVYEALREF